MSTGIQWTDETWNPIRARNKETGRVGHFCEKVDAACKNCYAEALQARYFGNPIHYGPGDRDKVELFLDERVLMQPFHWKRPRMVFPCSMTDLFGEWVPRHWIDRIMAVMALTPRHTYQVLTKRAKGMAEYFNDLVLISMVPEEYAVRTWRIMKEMRKLGGSVETMVPWPLPHLWLGASAGTQKGLEMQLPGLLRCPAAVRWLSVEPMLERVTPTALPDYCNEPGWKFDAFRYHRYHSAVPSGPRKEEWINAPGHPVIHWVVCGGESGHGYRALDEDNVRDLRDQCVDAGVAFYYKQKGGHTPKAGGRLLDGREWNEMPVLRPQISQDLSRSGGMAVATNP
ncbi:MAG TPA: DUF5131 family protein [Flavobacteriales bacterium]|nr:DUF5131 family protein [Flavobacteriales bacterium]